MARLARVVIPGLPHHVSQRGNGRSRVFFSDADYALYRDLLAASCASADVEVWAWCLMPNHVHLILTPHDEDGLRRALASIGRPAGSADFLAKIETLTARSLRPRKRGPKPTHDARRERRN